MRTVRFTISPHFSGRVPAQQSTLSIQTLPEYWQISMPTYLTKISRVGARNPTCQLICPQVKAP